MLVLESELSLKMVTVEAGSPPNIANPSDSAPRFPFFGNTTFYSFNDTIDSSVTSITIGGTYTESINQNIFVVPSMSYTNLPQVLVRAAVSSSITLLEIKLTFVVIDLALTFWNNVERHLALSHGTRWLSSNCLLAGIIPTDFLCKEGRLHIVPG